MGSHLLPSPPTECLPPLKRLLDISSSQLSGAFQNIRAIYFPQPLAPKRAPGKLRAAHHIHDTSVPDSGYASAEEDSLDPLDSDVEENDDLDVLRADTFERAHAVRWLTGFTARADTWLLESPPSELLSRTTLVDTAATLLAAFAGTLPEPALTRQFAFPTANGILRVELNDAPLLSADHTAVGLQSWASCIVLAERICAAPAAYGLAPGPSSPRVLELGAGTGLLSIVAAQLAPAGTAVVATDFHPSVLANLSANVRTNSARVDVLPLDWEHPVCAGALAARFDVVLAADVVYHPAHARWIRGCVARVLARGGVFWMVIALRGTGRHAEMGATVEAVFPTADDVLKGAEGEWKERDAEEAGGGIPGLELAVLESEEVGRRQGVGRADEGGYRLFKIGWVPA